MQRSTCAPEPDWHQQLRECFTSLASLRDAGLITDAQVRDAGVVAERYRLSIPRYYAELFDDVHPQRCPIRRQALADTAEVDPVLPAWARAWSLEAFGRPVPWCEDAIGDLAKQAAPRLTHRYHNRAIVHVSAACSMYCRFCFRKSHLNDAERRLYRGSLEPALAYLRATPDIREVILTGGDPLSWTDAALAKLLDAIETITHIRHVRIHSRMPVTLPARMTPNLAAILSGRSVNVALVAHFNHPKELTRRAEHGMNEMRRLGVTLYNQSVLLRHVNDDAETLYDLFQRLFEAGITPFYLHHPDWTPGTFHMRPSIARGRALVRRLEGRLSGPAMPRYVLDMPQGSGGKVLLSPDRVTLLEERVDNGLGGARYAITSAATRSPALGAGPLAYADFWFA